MSPRPDDPVAPRLEPAPDPLPGRVMGGYLVLDWLGSGAGAQVYRARDLRTDRLVALKTTGPELLRAPSTAGRWAREVGACAQVVHPNVVRTHGSGVTRDGVAYLVMELVEGGSLAEVLAARGPFSPSRAAAVGAAVLAGLGAIHARGLVHRDIKPGNIMLTGDPDLVRIIDFGLVSAPQGAPTDARLTQVGRLLGTPLYMAPERICGHQASPASDLYGLGVVLFELLTGRVPFEGEDLRQVLLGHLKAPVPTIEAFDGLGPLVKVLLAKAPVDRPHPLAVARRLAAVSGASIRA